MSVPIPEGEAKFAVFHCNLNVNHSKSDIYKATI